MPSFVLIVGFLVLPIVMTVYMSLFKKTLKINKYIGFQNYIRLSHDSEFIQSLYHTLLYVLILVSSVVIITVFLSYVISQKNERTASIFRGLFYIPTIASAVTVSIIWNWIFNPVVGIANYLVSSLGFEPIAWFSGRGTAFFCVCLTAFFGLIGPPVVLYTAAMGGVSKEYYEAANLDGASEWEKFWWITIPMVKPTTLYITIITAINAFQIFIPIQLLTKGGPVNSTTSLMYTLYSTAFTDNYFGYASSMGIILLLLLGAFSFMQFKLQNGENQ
jgi:multiple sugar transport system permease protein